MKKEQLIEFIDSKITNLEDEYNKGFDTALRNLKIFILGDKEQWRN